MKATHKHKYILKLGGYLCDICWKFTEFSWIYLTYGSPKNWADRKHQRELSKINVGI